LRSSIYKVDLDCLVDSQKLDIRANTQILTPKLHPAHRPSSSR